MITVVAGGDSFIYGSELADCNFYTHSENTFTSLLAKHHSYNYECAAWGGFSNNSVARATMVKCERLQSDNLFVIVNWSFPGRYEFRFNYETGERHSPWYNITGWTMEDNFDNIKEQFATFNQQIFDIQVRSIKRAKQTGTQEFAKMFYKHVGSGEYWEVYNTLKEIVYLQNYLLVNKIPYMFTCADNSILYNWTIDNPDETILALMSQINKHSDSWYWFPAGTEECHTQKPRGFYQWALENKYPMGTTHPLEQAHEDAAKLMQEKFNELVKKSL
jgi:hypothetical protein